MTIPCHKFHRYFASLALLTALNGCGISQQMVPNRPLAREETQIAVTWNYDFNKFSRFNFLPDVNVFVGVGGNTNLGAGLQAPFNLSHVSAAYYGESGEGYWAPFLHINRIWGLNTNPRFESGIMRIWNNDSWSHYLSLGVAYGRQFPSVVELYDERVELGDGSRRLMPTLKWSAQGRDFGASASAYLGFSKGIIDELERFISEESDTVFAMASNEVDSIILYPDSVIQIVHDNIPRKLKVVAIIYTGDSAALTLSRERIWMCGGAFPIVLLMASDELRYNVRLEGDYKWLLTDSSNFDVLLDVESLVEQWRTEDSVVITRFPDRKIRESGLDKRWWWDLSVGAAVLAHPDRDTL